ncbi:hypothetical protein WJX72_003228 [[Myrmecia] bisecta]|uniref:Ribosome biogenesis protein SLX9 n=1 Tax=[Myrmecia] bisecta TaxID=41462 RepID=A0AAW1Q0K9_9CHLO
MVKKKLGGSRGRKVPKASQQDAKADKPQKGTELQGPSPPVHIRKKVARRVRFFEKVAASNPLGARGTIQKKQKRRRQPSAALADLSTLADSLGEAANKLTTKADKKQKGLGVGGCKARTRITADETARLQQVLAHPHFKANPIAAITNHLTAMLPPVPEPAKPKTPSAQELKEKRRQRKHTKRLAATAQDMEDDDL